MHIRYIQHKGSSNYFSKGKWRYAIAKRILIVDDDPRIVFAMELLMSNAGYEAAVARDGKEALEILAKFKPDLAVLDVMLPHLSGFDVCRIIKESPKRRHIKVIFVSAKSRQKDIDRGLQLGAEAYITKPFSNKELREKVDKLLAE